MAARLRMVVLLGWVLAGFGAAAHGAAAVPPRVEEWRLPGGMAPASRPDAVWAVSDRSALAQAAGRRGSRQVRPSGGAWPLLSVATRLATLPRPEALALPQPPSAYRIRSRPSSPRAPPVGSRQPAVGSTPAETISV